MPEPVRLLCTGDLHLGRYPSRVPTGQRELTVASVWEELVEYAVTQEVDAVVLTGDVVDRENRFYESFGPLQRGLQRLAERHIDSVAVAGNHDFDVLPRMSDVLDTDHFTLLGRGGKWESYYLEREGEVRCRLLGWSFPTEHYARSPFDSLDYHDEEVPTLGLLHADYEQPHSQYAPVTSAELERHPIHGWLLGHVHKPGRLELDRFALYPGSLQALDPGEEGRHDPWLIEVTPGGEVREDQVSVSTVRYDTIPVDVSEVDGKETFEQTVIQALRNRLRELAHEQEKLKQVSFRLEYQGNTPLYQQLEEYSRQITSDLTVPFGEATAVVDDVVVAAHPPLDLSELAKGNDPPGVLADLLLSLEQAQEGGDQALVQDAIQALASVYNANAYEPLLADEETAAFLDHEEMRQILLKQGRMLLSELLNQKVQD